MCCPWSPSAHSWVIIKVVRPHTALPIWLCTQNKSHDLSLRLPICNTGTVTTPPQCILRVKEDDTLWSEVTHSMAGFSGLGTPDF